MYSIGCTIFTYIFGSDYPKNDEIYNFLNEIYNISLNNESLDIDIDNDINK